MKNNKNRDQDKSYEGIRSDLVGIKRKFNCVVS